MRAVLGALIISMSGCSFLIDLPNLDCDAVPPEACGLERAVNTTTPLDQDAPAVAASADHFLAVFEDESGDQPDTDARGIRARLFDGCGEPIAQDFVLNQSYGGDQNGPKVAAGADNRFFIVWTTSRVNNSSQVFGRLLGSRDDTFTEFEIATSTIGQRNAAVAAATNPLQYLVVWQDKKVGIRGRMLDAGGAKLRMELVVEEDPQDEGDILTSVAYTGRDFFVVWNRLMTKTVVGRFISLNGDRSADYVLSTQADGDELIPTVASTGDTTLVTWARNGNEIVGRFIASDGQASDTFVISEGTSTEKERATVTALADKSRFFVIWEELDSSTEEEMRGRLVEKDGLLGELYKLNRITKGSQKEPALASGPLGTLVLWSDSNGLIPDNSKESVRFTFLPSGASCTVVQ